MELNQKTMNELILMFNFDRFTQIPDEFQYHFWDVMMPKIHSLNSQSSVQDFAEARLLISELEKKKDVTVDKLDVFQFVEGWLTKVARIFLRSRCLSQEHMTMFHASILFAVATQMTDEIAPLLVEWHSKKGEVKDFQSKLKDILERRLNQFNAVTDRYVETVYDFNRYIKTLV